MNDAAGAYHEIWLEGGSATVADLAPGQASVSQLTATTDYAFGSPAVNLVEVPSGAVATLSIVNFFLDADGDGIGDSVDTCSAGNDAVDADTDGTADACDDTPSGEPEVIVTPEASEPTPAATEHGSADSPADPCAANACAPTPSAEAPPAPTQEDTTLSVEVDDTTIVVAEAPVTCTAAEDAAPWVASDLADYPPGALVTLTGGGWVPGQTVEIVVEDDGVADAEMGPWSHAATVTADAQGGFVYKFNLAPWFVANYSVVANGECSEARTAFTDSVSGGSCEQVPASDLVSPGEYVVFHCPHPLLSIGSLRLDVTSLTPGWQWAYQFSNSANPPYSPSSWRTTTGAPPAGSGAGVNIFLSPTSAVTPASAGSVNVEISATTLLGGLLRYSSTLTAYRAITASNFSLACTPASFAVQASASQTVSCTLSTISLASTASVTAAIPAITAPSGWSVTAPTPASGAVTTSTSLDFSFTLTASCTASTTAQSVSVASNLTFRSVLVTGPSTTVLISRASSTTLSAAISANTLAWTRPYSFTAFPTNTGALTYSVQASGCAGWNVTVAASPFTRSGGTNTIPAANLTLTSSTTPAGTGISQPATTGALSSALKVLSASAGNGNGTYAQTLNLNLAIPAKTPVGAYTSTVTITAASGP